MNWTQPICNTCYLARHPGRQAVRVKDADPETCCDCGEMTMEGIYFRVDPRTVAFPTEGEASDIHEGKS